MTAAFADPTSDPRWGAFALEALPKKLAAAGGLLVAVALVMLRPDKVKVLGWLRSVLLVPIAGSWIRFAGSCTLLLVVTGLLQWPVLTSARVRVHACSDPVTICLMPNGSCDEELARADANKVVDLRIDRGESIAAVAANGETIWAGTAEGPSYSEPRKTVESCEHTRYEVACEGTLLRVFAHNEDDRALSIFGFELQPVYNAVFPEVSARVDIVPRYDPLDVQLGKLKVATTTGPALVEIPKHDSGLVEIPLQTKRPDDHTIYQHDARLCVRLALVGKARCLPWLVLVSVGSGGTNCKARTDDNVWEDVSKTFAEFRAIDNPELVKLLAALRPTPTAELVVHTYTSAKSTPDNIGLILQLLDVMAYLNDPTSLHELQRAKDDSTAITSVRVAALTALERRDRAFDKRDALLAWTRDSDPELAAKALELLPVQDRSKACVERLAGFRCEDGIAFVVCQSLTDPATHTAEMAWRQRCEPR